MSLAPVVSQTICQGTMFGVVLQVGDQHFIARLQRRPRVALRDEIDRLGGAAHENDLGARARIDEARHAVARGLVHRGRFLAQGMNAAMNVGVVTAFVVVDGLDDRLRALRGGAVVQIGQRFRRAPGASISGIGGARPRHRRFGPNGRVQYFSSKIPQDLRVG